MDWIDKSKSKPLKSGIYKVRFKDDNHSDDYGRFSRRCFGLLDYWSDEKYGLRVITHWAHIESTK